MRGVFSSGDVIFSLRVDASDLREGDIITFYSEDPNFFGLAVTHRIIKVLDDGAFFVTQGDANSDPDAVPVPSGNILGRYIFRIPKLGYVVEFFFTPLGYVIMVLVPFAFFTVSYGVQFVLLLRRGERKDREPYMVRPQEYSEKDADIENEKELAELQRMKTYLENLAASRAARIEGTATEDLIDDSQSNTDAIESIEQENSEPEPELKEEPEPEPEEEAETEVEPESEEETEPEPENETEQESSQKQEV